MEAFLQGYRSAGLKNGCLPEAYLFYDAFRQRFPEAKPEVILLELPEGNTALYGHAVVVFRGMSGVFLWDHEAGLVPVDAPVPADESALRTAVAESYLRAIARLKASLRTGGFCHPITQESNDQAACRLAARLPGARQPQLIVYRTPRHGCRKAVTFTGGGLVWLYLPETGTAFTPVRPGCSKAQLVLAALRTALPQAEIVPGAPVTAPNDSLATL